MWIFGKTNENEGCFAHISKHLKGLLDPPFGDVTFFCIKGGQLALLVTLRFMHQWRSVGPSCWWRYIFLYQRRSVGPPCWWRYVFFLHQTGSVDPPVGNITFFCIRGGQLNPPVGDVMLFCIRGGKLDPPVGFVYSNTKYLQLFCMLQHL